MTLAGLYGNATTVNGMGTNARFNKPLGMAVDLTRNVYVCESGSDYVRRISSAGLLIAVVSCDCVNEFIQGVVTSVAAKSGGFMGIVVSAQGDIFATANANTVDSISSSG